MSDRTGEEYEATVSGVTAFGVFAELDNTVEGLIRLEKLPGGSYEYLEDKFVLKGERTFRLGDRIKIRVDGCDWGNMRPEFSLADMPAESGKNTQKSDEPKRERKPRKKQSTVQSVHKKGSSSAHKKGTPYAHKKGADKNTKKFVKSRQSRGKRR